MSIPRGLAAVSIALACALAGCGGGKHEYPEAAKQNFLNACEQSGTKSFCECALDKLREKMSYEDFKKEDTAIRAGRKPSRTLTDAVSECRQ